MCNDHGKTYALYAITVFCRNNDGSEDCWKTYRRYSDFHDFHMRITEQVGGGAPSSLHVCAHMNMAREVRSGHYPESSAYLNNRRFLCQMHSQLLETLCLV